MEMGCLEIYRNPYRKSPMTKRKSLWKMDWYKSSLWKWIDNSPIYNKFKGIKDDTPSKLGLPRFRQTHIDIWKTPWFADHLLVYFLANQEEVGTGNHTATKINGYSPELVIDSEGS
jgi:hypothetical protein